MYNPRTLGSRHLVTSLSRHSGAPDSLLCQSVLLCAHLLCLLLHSRYPDKHGRIESTLARPPASSDTPSAHSSKS